MFVHKCVFITMCQVSTGVVYMKEHNPAHYGMCRQGKWQSRDLLYSSQPTPKTTFINQVGGCIRLKKKKKKQCVRGVILICIQVNFRDQHILWLRVRQIAKHDWLCLIVGIMCDLWPIDCVSLHWMAHLNINDLLLVLLWNVTKLFLIFQCKWYARRNLSLISVTAFGSASLRARWHPNV